MKEREERKAKKVKVDQGSGLALWINRTFGRKNVEKKIGFIDVLKAVLMIIFVFFCAFITSFLNTASYIIFIPFSLKKAYKAMSQSSEIFFALLPWLMENYCKMKLTIYGDVIPEQENAFVFGNHQWILDWGVYCGLAARKGRAGGLKIFAKNFVKYIPFFGWGLWMLGGIFVKRNWENDRASIEKTFARLKTLGDQPMWVVTWPEGTRVTDLKLKDCHKFAAEKNLPILNYCLIPRTRGFVATIKSLRDILPYVYDITTAYELAPPSVLDVAVGNYNHGVHMLVKRYKMEDLPTDDEGLKNWLIDRFVEKDKLLEYFHDHNCFPAEPLHEPLQFIRTVFK